MAALAGGVWATVAVLISHMVVDDHRGDAGDQLTEDPDAQAEVGERRLHAGRDDGGGGDGGVDLHGCGGVGVRERLQRGW